MKLQSQKVLPDNDNETVEDVENVFEVGMFVPVEAHNNNFGEHVEGKPKIEGQEQVIYTVKSFFAFYDFLNCKNSREGQDKNDVSKLV